MTDRPRARAAMAEFLRALGREEALVEETAGRVTDAYFDELLWGEGADIARLVLEGSEPISGGADPVVLGGLRTATVCPHHLLVARGTGLLAYVPGERVLGLGTAARLLDACSRRFVLQEQIARDVTRALMEEAGARGAFCRLEFDHACLQTRGARQSEAVVTTWSGAGTLEDLETLRVVLGTTIVPADVTSEGTK